jgi:hypothetical protein
MPTSLTSLVLGQLQLPNASQLIPWAYNKQQQQQEGWQKYADLAPLASIAAGNVDC